SSAFPPVPFVTTLGEAARAMLTIPFTSSYPYLLSNPETPNYTVMAEQFGHSILRDCEGGTEMYSVVLMAALTTGSTTTDWHHCAACGSYGGGGAGGQDFYGAGYEGCGCWGGYSRWGYCNMPPPNPGAMGGHGVAGGTLTPGMGTAVPGTAIGGE